MGLKITIEDAARHALKNHEPELLMTLRMLLSAVKNREIEKRARLAQASAERAKSGEAELTEEEMIAIVRSEGKKRRDAMAEFAKGGRNDLVEKEASELAILEKYLPQELSDEEIEKLLLPLVAKGATEKDFGRIMSVAMKVVGGRASGDRVSAAVKRMLTGR